MNLRRRISSSSTGGSARLLAAVLVVAMLMASCSSDSDDKASDPTGGSGSTTTTADGKTPEGEKGPDLAAKERPEGPAASIAEELTGGTGPSMPDLIPVDYEAEGFEQHEYAVQGTATAYVAEDPETDMPADGTFNLTPGSTTDYTTRAVVRRPADAADFNGTVVVEWLNVSGGLDANPDWSYLSAELLRGGYAWVGVSAQRIGVEGGDVAVPIPIAGDLAGQGLKATNPERYGDLSHPGDAYSYDIFTQVARAVRASDDSGLLGPLSAEVVLAAGESQSGYALTTYADGVQPLTEIFDGFLIHSRGGGAASLGKPGEGENISSAVAAAATRIRTDLDVPVLMLQTESDVLGVLNYFPARQPDTDLIRLWEVAGTAHVDEFMLGPIADSMGCSGQINDGPLHLVAKSALRHLDEWARTGTPPPTAERFEIDETGDTPAYKRDEDGIVLGGIRTPEVDVPVDVHSGEPTSDASVICLLLGSTKPLSPERIAALYPSADAYTSEYEKSADAAIEAGFVLAEDRESMLSDADPSRVAG